MTIPSVQETAPRLDGVEKVAAVLLSLDRDASSRLLKHFDLKELKQIARVASRLQTVPSAELDEICHGLIDEICHGQPDLKGGDVAAEALLATALPDEQVADIMSDVRGRSNGFLWRRLSALSPRLLGDYLSAEHPQTAAVVLARLDSAVASSVLGCLPGAMRAQAMRRMLVSRPTSEQVLHIVEEALQEDLFAAASSPATGDVSVRVAGIVNQLDRAEIAEILSGIAETEPALAEQLKGMIFSFEDIVRLDQRARLIVFDQASTERVILALRGADWDVRDAVLPCLSARTRRMVEAELAAPGDPPRREIAAAQREIANVVLRLAEQGMIDLISHPEAGRS